MYIGQNIKVIIKKVNHNSLFVEYKHAKSIIEYDDILDYKNYNLKDIFSVNEIINVKVINIIDANNFNASFKVLHHNFSKLQTKFFIKETPGGFNKLKRYITKEYNE
ncbi:hypothetical protein QLQ80_02310 [Mycoplasma sp. M5725]|uniref:Uncharacterized protein n=1 Tax=Mycoplasma phocimorsus TaxID=3045839 RepID=A0AAJ1PU69_9MOLU|nr:hypothetical protein [Mycoplasma phocimorsus]MDJ1645906.1 hypothetical protein [Mycoplasma phocimorsus]